MPSKQLHLRRAILIPFTVVLFTILIGITYGIFIIENQSINKNTEENTRNFNTVFENEISQDTLLISTIIENLANNKNLQQAWLKKDRDTLYHAAIDIYTKLNSKHRITHFYFTDLQQINFLRVHNKNKYGDKINRFTTRHAVKTNRLSSGLELGKYGTLTLRIVYPWYINNKLSGYIELGEEIQHIIRKTKSITQHSKTILTLNKNNLSKELWQEGEFMLSRKSHWDEFTNFVVIGNVSSELKEAYFEHINSPTLEIHHKPDQQHIHKTIQADDAFLSGGSSPLFDVRGQLLGNFHVIRDITAQKNKLFRFIVFSLLISGLIFIVVWLFYYLYVGKIDSVLQTSKKKLTDEIEERKQAQKISHDYINIISQIKDAIIQIDLNGDIKRWNNGASILFCYQEINILNKKFSIIFEESEKTTSLNKIIAITKENGSFAEERKVKKKTGAVFDANISYTIAYNESGHPVAINTYTVDITEKIKNQKELLISKEKAEQASKAKTAFLSQMSHELRTPLNAILGFAQLLELGTESQSEEEKESVNEILKAGHYLLELINEVLDLAKIEADKMQFSIEPVDHYSIINECIDLLAPMAQKQNIDINITNTLADNTVVIADYTRLKQIIVNLVSNAIKYNHKNGSVTIEISASKNHDKHILISVIDVGPGIAKDKQHLLFQPFERLEKNPHKTEGTGIGLALTSRLIEKMNGYIGVSSREGEGSCFWIELPSTVPSQLDANKSNNSTNTVRITNENLTLAGKTKLLYIEDNPANLKLVKNLISRYSNIEFISAHNGELGFELADAHCPDLILLDINLPGIDGYQLLKQIKGKSHLVNIPVIAISANAMENDIKKGVSAGFNDYLTKPINIKSFYAIVEQYIKNINIDNKDQPDNSHKLH